MSKGSWYEQDFNGAEREQEKRDLGGQPKRWWMPAGSSKELVFVDDIPFCFHEHQWKTGDSKFPEFATCVSKIQPEPCAGCTTRGVQKAEYTGHMTVVDITGYRTKDGKEVRFELVEFCPKLQVINKVKLKKERKGTMCGHLYSVTRATDKTPNTGDDLDFIREAKMEELYKVVTYKGKNISELITKANSPGDDANKIRKYLAHHFQIPKEGPIAEQIPVFNYQELHAPLEPADFKRVVAGAVGYSGDNSSSGGSKPSGGSSADDSVPF